MDTSLFLGFPPFLRSLRKGENLFTFRSAFLLRLGGRDLSRPSRPASGTCGWGKIAPAPFPVNFLFSLGLEGFETLGWLEKWILLGLGTARAPRGRPSPALRDVRPRCALRFLEA